MSFVNVQPVYQSVLVLFSLSNPASLSQVFLGVTENSADKKDIFRFSWMPSF